MASNSDLGPISWASTIIGFISFFLTMLIWTNNFWFAFTTIGSAPSQLRDELSTLRQALYEEREHLRRVRSRSRSKRPSSRRPTPKNPTAGEDIYFEKGSFKVIHDAVKDLIYDFRRLEEPFLVPLREGKEKELEWSYDATQQCYKCDFWHRVLWLRAKGGVEAISGRLQQLQTRRIAAEVSETYMMLAETQGMVRRYEDRLWAIEDRLRMSHIG